jgi:hypothetical protein
VESNRNYATPVYLSSIDTGEPVVVISGLGDRSRIPLRGEDDDDGNGNGDGEHQQRSSPEHNSRG